MSILTFEVVGTCIPATIFKNRLTFLNIMKVKVRRPSKVLLTMSIVAFGPFMFFINIRTKTCLVSINHKLF